MVTGKKVDIGIELRVIPLVCNACMKKSPEEPVVIVYIEELMWTELEAQPVAAIVRKLKGNTEALHMDKVEMTDELCTLEFIKKQHKKMDLIKQYIQVLSHHNFHHTALPSIILPLYLCCCLHIPKPCLFRPSISSELPLILIHTDYLTAKPFHSCVSALLSPPSMSCQSLLSPYQCPDWSIILPS
jgi:(2Fe-2S) ferredoxin